MTIEATTRAPFSDEWTQISLSGDSEAEVFNILAARLLGAGWELLEESPEGDLIDPDLESDDAP